MYRTDGTVVEFVVITTFDGYVCKPFNHNVCARLFGFILARRLSRKPYMGVRASRITDPKYVIGNSAKNGTTTTVIYYLSKTVCVNTASERQVFMLAHSLLMSTMSWIRLLILQGKLGVGRHIVLLHYWILYGRLTSSSRRVVWKRRTKNVTCCWVRINHWTHTKLRVFLIYQQNILCEEQNN